MGFFDLFSSTRGRYRVLGTLRGHTKSVFSLSFSVDGKYLASGGGDGVKVWDMKTYTSIRTPDYRSAFGPVSQVLWIPTRSGVPTVCSGTGLGYLWLWAQNTDSGAFTEVFAKRLGGGAEILGLACEFITPTDTRIAISDRSCFVGVYSYDGRANLLPIFTARINHSIPISVSFANTKGREVYVFGLHDGTMYRLSGTDGKILASKTLSDKIGHASIQARQQLLVVDNVSSGFDVWNLNGEMHQRTFPTGKPTRFLPRQVNFADDARTIVGGSDHGAVYVFDRRTGAPIDVLHHSQHGLVQTIATTERDGFSIIASGTSCGTGSILIWRAKKAPITSPKQRTTVNIARILRVCIHLMMLAAAMAFLWQNYGEWASLSMWAQSAGVVARQPDSSLTARKVVRGHDNAHHDWSKSGTAIWKEWRTYIESREAREARETGEVPAANKARILRRAQEEQTTQDGAGGFIML